jgi:hypothetical protein
VGLELLPVEALLIVVAAGDGVVISEVALPLWYGILVIVAGRLLGLRLRPSGSATVAALTAPLVLASWALLLQVSPAEYGSTAGSPLDVTWLGTFVADVASGSDRAGHALGLLLLLAYLWFRGVRLGTRPPLLDDVLRRFKVGMAVLIFAIAALALTQTPVRAPAIGAFTFLLPAEVFCGLVASALTRLAEHSLSGGPESERQLPWVSSAIGLAGGIVVFALLLGIIFNGGNVSALLAHLGPVGAALNDFGRWFSDAIGQLFGLIFGAPIRALKSAGAHLTTTPLTTPSACKTKACEQPANSPPPLFLTILGLLFSAFFVLILVLLFLRLYRLVREWIERQAHPAQIDATEERESLDGRSLLRKQLRDLFRRRRPVRARRVEEPLDPRSIRGLYREVLRAAARAGLPRLSTETPDEFARRAAGVQPLALSPAESAVDLAALSESYDAARYGDLEESAADRTTAGERARRLVARLRPRGR